MSFLPLRPPPPNDITTWGIAFEKMPGGLGKFFSPELQRVFLDYTRHPPPGSTPPPPDNVTIGNYEEICGKYEGTCGNI